MGSELTDRTIKNNSGELNVDSSIYEDLYCHDCRNTGGINCIYFMIY